MGVMNEMKINNVEWIVKSQNEIVDWYLKSGVFDSNPFKSDIDSSLVYYESLVSNYVAYHANMFSGVSPEFIWHELTLYDWRLNQIENPRSKPNPKSRVVPDLIFQFDSELWMIEVKYRPQSPDIEKIPRLKTIQPVDKQVDIYTERLTNVIKLGWFPGCVEIHPVVFWAYFYPRPKIKPHLDVAYSKWPIDRTEQTVKRSN